MTNHSGIADSGDVFQIIPTTRKILVPVGHSILGAVGDHNSEQITFKCPALIDGHEVGKCTRHSVVWKNASGQTGRDTLTSIKTQGDNIYLTWTITNAITKEKGYINFSVMFEDIISGTTVYSWSTAICNECSIIETAVFMETGAETSKVLTVTKNGTYPTTDYSYVNVAVPTNDKKLVALTATENAVYYPDAAQNEDGFNKVTVYVEPKLQELTLTGNTSETGVVPPEGVDGFSRVIVNVPEDAPVLQTKSETVKVGDGQKTITADAGFDGLQQVHITVQELNKQNMTVTPSEEMQYASVGDGFDCLGTVTIEKIPSQYVVPSETGTFTGNQENIDVTNYKTITIAVPSNAKEEETKVVELDFSNGNMNVVPESGKVMNEVTIQIPATLLASNIKKGVTIAGITGTYEGFDGTEQMYIGASANTSVTVEEVRGFTSCDPVNGRFVFDTTAIGYVYLVTPAHKPITSIMMDGFQMLNADITAQGYMINLDGRSYQVYRTNDRQAVAEYAYEITFN